MIKLMDSAVKIQDLSVTLSKSFLALKDVNLDLPAGKTIGFIGPSGAGKTTLIRGIVGRLKTAPGSIEVLGLPAGTASLRQQVSYMTQELSVYTDLTVRENLDYFVTMIGQPRQSAAKVIKDVLETVGLAAKAETMVSSLSGGQKQRLSLAIALLGSPKLMVLDEPTVGLDPVLRVTLWELFDRLAKQGVTLIISSHSMDEAERCDDLVLIRDGEILAHSSPGEFCKKTNTKSVEAGFLKLVGDAK